MFHPCIKVGVVLAAGTLAFASQAFALSPHSLRPAATLVVPAGDEENAEVWHNLRPDVTPPRAAVGNQGEAEKGSNMETPKGEGSGDEENAEVWHNLRPDVTPPPPVNGN